MEKPKCIKWDCKGILRKVNKTINSNTYRCDKCGQTVRLEKRIGSGWNYK